MIATETLDQRIAEELLGDEYSPHWHRFTTEPEDAEQLAHWLVLHDIKVELSGTTVTLRHRKERLFAASGDTAMIALARVAVRLLDERPDLVAR